MFLGWELSSWSSISKWSKIVKSEKFGNHQVVYQDEAVTWNALKWKSQYINEEIEMLLRPYITTVWVKWSKS